MLLQKKEVFENITISEKGYCEQKSPGGYKRDCCCS